MKRYTRLQVNSPLARRHLVGVIACLAACAALACASTNGQQNGGSDGVETIGGATALSGSSLTGYSSIVGGCQLLAPEPGRIGRSNSDTASAIDLAGTPLRDQTFSALRSAVDGVFRDPVQAWTDLGGYIHIDEVEVTVRGEYTGGLRDCGTAGNVRIFTATQVVGVDLPPRRLLNPSPVRIADAGPTAPVVGRLRSTVAAGQAGAQERIFVEVRGTFRESVDQPDWRLSELGLDDTHGTDGTGYLHLEYATEDVRPTEADLASRMLWELGYDSISDVPRSDRAELEEEIHEQFLSSSYVFFGTFTGDFELWQGEEALAVLPVYEVTEFLLTIRHTVYTVSR